ncbi:MAG: helix-turn-helix domain-containing protein [Gammaproteobacteria bacterium]|nr:helix-turn-helix domain-containing protein [Gammaproteobacteria bacterium]
MSFGDNVKRLRRDKGLTQQQLADMCDIRMGQISKIERNSTDPKLSTINQIMKALGCTANSLFLDEDTADINGIMLAALERIGNLPDKNKEHLIDVIDNYCIAVGFRLQTSIHEDKSTWMLWQGQTKSMLK